MSRLSLRELLLLLLLHLLMVRLGCNAQFIGVNWGTRASHRLYAPDVVRMLASNKVGRVKLLEPDASIMKALGGSKFEVMLGIPNSMLEPLANSLQAAQDWVEKNVTAYLKHGRKYVNIVYVSVGNEPFQNDVSEGVILTALQHVQRSLDDQRTRVKATVAFSQGDVNSTSVPSTGKFKDVDKVTGILKALSRAEAPFSVNIHPFFSSFLSSDFPLEFSFFDNGLPFIQDGAVSYTNVFDATFDTVVAALEDAGFGDLRVIVGETGWPSDCEAVANLVNARRFNQGLINRLLSGRGTPRRPSSPLHAYIFNLFDEDLRSTQPGNFERHWGLFYFDGKVKYVLEVGTGPLAEVPNVKYLPVTWCVYDESKQASAELLEGRIADACGSGDCTPIYGNGSCSLYSLETRASFAFNNRYQFNDHEFWSCDFDYAMFVNTQQSIGDCRFPLQIVVSPGLEESRSVFPSIATTLLVWFAGQLL